MNNRQRFNVTMHYQPRDRSPICDFSFWPETIHAWHDQGLSRSIRHDCVETNAFFGMDPLPTCVDCVGLMPTFEFHVIEDRGEYELVQQNDGVRVLRKKSHGLDLHARWSFARRSRKLGRTLQTTSRS